ncbi:restriction endonuclease subunit S [Phormidium sp. FACHB-1136]|uniref:restriction endonuclease subunit S n=1 Tax=Phormidium sp. FACHB-1136 TaxID=2692848 RepID=UPI0016846471|nr:restriction endonuclease subunit S [Phormidium sp. FACHB-1136]MBD2427583.1 restriction endonuclease subunit S [Phormidium sp. FACHB-1136]
MQQLLTGKRRFPEFSQDTWESKPLEEIVYIQMGTSPASQFYNNEKCGLPLVQGMSSILNGYAEPKIWTRQITQTALPNDILLSVRAPVGVAAKTQQQICIGRGIASLRSKEGINQEFIFQALQFSELKWRKLVRGSTFEAVTSAEVKKFAISTPSSYEEQCKIAQFLKLFDDEIVLNCRLLKLLISQKNGLMQKLLTGDIRIPVSEDTP